MAAACIGTSGFTYRHWRGVFYPADLPPARWFDHYVQHFNGVELNVTFYRLPPPAAFAAWASRAPPGFRFALKGSRFITHIRRLQRPREPLERVFAAARPLGNRLACTLWQLPPGFRADVDRLRAFLGELEALPGARGIRHAFEFRDPTWFAPAVYRTLERADAALVLADAPLQVVGPGARGPRPRRPLVRVPLTASWTYLRRHDPGPGFGGSYPEAMVRADAAWIRRQLAAGRDVFAFYNNDVGGHAVENARLLARLVAAGRARGRGRPSPA